MNLIEALATIFGLLCVWLTTRQNVWCWPTGLVQVFLYIFVFYDAKLYSDMILHIIYVVMQIYGWYHWLHGGENAATLQVSILGKRIAPWILVAIVGSAIWGFFMYHFTDAAAPFADAFIASSSIVAQWLMTRKNVESWYFWIAVDIIAIGVYWYKGLYFTVGLYALFLVLCIIGLHKWQQSLREITTTPTVAL